MRSKLAALVAIAVAASACTSAAQRFQAWQGKPIGDLIASRGPADRIVAYPFGGRLYIWEQESMRAAPGDMGRRSGSPRVENVVRREIAHVNDEGIITATRVENEIPRAAAPSGY